MQALRQRSHIILNGLLDALDDIQGRRAAGLVYGHQRAALSVGAHDIRLRGETVADVGDVAHVNRGAIYGLYRQIVQFLNGLRSAVHFHVVFEGAELSRSRWQNQILRIHGVDDVDRRQPLGLEQLRIQIHCDLALLTSIRKRQGRALHGGQLCADEIVSEIKDGLLAQAVACQTNLNDRYGGRGIDGHQGGGGAWRQKSENGLDDGGGLSERGLNIRVRLKIDLYDGDAVQRLRFDVLDVVHQRGHCTLRVRRDALLHVLRREPVVVPYQADDGDIDFRKNVGGCAHQHHRRQQNHRERHHDERVRSGQR